MIEKMKSHMSTGLIGSGVLLFLTAVFFFQGFLQNEYLRYLLAQTSKTESALLEASATNFDSMLRDAIMIGAGVAADQNLYGMVEKIYKENDTVLVRSGGLDGTLNSITHYSNTIAGTAIVTEDGLLREYGRYWYRSGYDELWEGENEEQLQRIYEQVMERTKMKNAISYVVSTEPMFHKDFSDMTFVHLAFPLVGQQFKKSNSYAAVVFTLRLDEMVARSALSNPKQESYIKEYITDADGKILYHKNSSELGEIISQDDNRIEKLDRPLDYLGWSIHIDIDKEAIRDKVHQMFAQGMGVYLMLLLICIVIWQLMLWRILKPVGVIGKAMQETKNGNLENKIEIKGTHELWQLAEKYNCMVDDLEKQRKETQREYEEKTISIQRCGEAEREALESQINAHFLCNTLGAINYSAIENGDTEVSVLLKNLSGILYYTFSQQTKQVTLGEEIEWVCQYLFLQKFRLMDVFDYEIIFPEEYTEWPCCKLFLQPFVENSIFHGFEGWERGGKIRITGKESEGRLVIEIYDNGIGMQPDVRDAIRSTLTGKYDLELNTKGIGIRNVAARLRMYYGPDMEIRLDSEPGKGTCFTLWLPIPKDMLEETADLLEEDME